MRLKQESPFQVRNGDVADRLDISHLVWGASSQRSSTHGLTFLFSFWLPVEYR